MAYYAPFYRPTYYNPMQTDAMNQFNQQFQQPVPQPVAQPMTQQANNGLVWVQGEAGAKSFLVAPGATVMLMDAENSTFYLKSADASGMPLPLRVFDYKERNEAPQQPAQPPTAAHNVNFDNFVTRDELEQRLSSMPSQCQCKNKCKNKEDVADAESAV